MMNPQYSKLRKAAAPNTPPMVPVAVVVERRLGNETTHRLQEIVARRGLPVIRTPSRAATPVMLRAPEEVLDDARRAQIEAHLERREPVRLEDLLSFRAD